MEDEATYHELILYTLAHPSPEFIHQYVIDAFAAQHPSKHSKPITLWFALAGLYLHLEKGFTGKQVQMMHIQMAASHNRNWPIFDPPLFLGAVTVHSVLACHEGRQRDEEIQKWCISVWGAWHECHERVSVLIKECLDI